MNDTPAGRSAVNAHSTPFLPYDMEGPVQPEMSWLPVSYESETGQGTYLMRMQPGAVTIAHDHAGMEEFLILEGDLVRHAPQLVDGDRLPHRRLRVASAHTSVKPPRSPADSESDSRLGTDGNQPGLEHEKGRRTTPPFSCAVTLPCKAETVTAECCPSVRSPKETERGSRQAPALRPRQAPPWRNRLNTPQ